MKALILAAGIGSRLGEISKQLPKPMIEVNGKPILAHNIDLCINADVHEICINLHHLPHVIKDYFGDGSEFGVNITYNYEPSLLGTAGALLPFQDILKDDPFFVIYGDNYICFDLVDLKLFNERMKADISILFHWRRDINNSGMAKFDSNGQIKNFIEKPISTSIIDGWANAGVYYIERSNIFNIVNEKDDFGYNFFPKCLSKGFKLFGLKKNINLTPIDTPDLLSSGLEKFEKN
ncbi:MAG: nucleotidyltransferase family protein [Candidatus Marinimicrobia bacterium]|nr:nucleotidyltransferase family protein [Candidatus Neomarinimicrobiota bacterium]